MPWSGDCRPDPESGDQSSRSTAIQTSTGDAEERDPDAVIAAYAMPAGHPTRARADWTRGIKGKAAEELEHAPQRHPRLPRSASGRPGGSPSAAPGTRGSTPTATPTDMRSRSRKRRTSGRSTPIEPPFAARSSSGPLERSRSTTNTAPASSDAHRWSSRASRRSATFAIRTGRPAARRPAGRSRSRTLRRSSATAIARVDVVGRHPDRHGLGDVVERRGPTSVSSSQDRQRDRYTASDVANEAATRPPVDSDCGQQ